MKKYKVSNLDDLNILAEKVFVDIKDANINTLALVGNLGAGKTTFVQMLAKKLGINETVNSPTFTIMKKYQIPNDEKYDFLVHMDVYRLDEVSELRPLKFEEVLGDDKNLICIEWADKITEALPKNLVQMTFFINENGEREVEVEGLG